MPPSKSNGGLDIAARLDRLPLAPLHWAISLICALGLIFDLVEMVLSSALGAVFSAPPHQIAPYRLALLLASVFVGGAVAAPLVGAAADRRGRRVVLQGALFGLAATSLLAAASTDVAWLTFFRVLSGVALGAYPPLMVAYLADVLPPARRGMLIMITGAIGSLGAPGVIFFIRWLTPLQPLHLEAWRWALLLGSVGAAAVAALFRCLPESPRWLAAVGRGGAADAACRRFERSAAATPTRSATETASAMGSFEAPARLEDDASIGKAKRRLWSAANRHHRPRVVLLVCLYFLTPWATVGFPLLSGAVLIEKGFRVTDSLLYLGVAMLGPTLGALAAALVIDRAERRTTLVLCGIAMALAAMVFAASATPAALMLSSLAFTLVGAIYVGALSIYGAELFPTAVRAAANASAWASNRVASAVAPLVLLPLLKTGGAIIMTLAIAAALAAATALVAFGPRGLARRPVE